jgi:hypothetical protein
VKLLEAQPEVTPGTPPEPPGETPQESAATEPAARSCTSCGAALAPDQDWCLACGHAAAPLAERAGWRAAMTVLGITLALLAGAVAASYAALSDDPGAGTATTAAPVVAAAPPAATTAPPAATGTTPTTTTTTGSGASKLPKVVVPSTSSSGATPRTASTSSSATPRATSPSPVPAPAPSSGSGGTSSGSGSSGSSGSPSQGTGTGTTTTPAPSPSAQIDIAGEQASIYDPYHRAANSGDPGRAVDGDAGTSWFVEPPPGSQQVNAGFAIDLARSRGVRSIDITTLTPGFKVEVYATDELTPPPSILDARWAHITDKSDVGGSGATEHIVLGAGTSKYRTVLLWITKPPSDGTRVRISELELVG